MQTTLLTLGIALILALVAALVGPLFVDWGRLRTDFEARASQMAGQPVRITGSIDVRLLPTPTIRLHRIEVGPPDVKPALGARGVDAELSLAALMRGQWRATVLRIDAPHVVVERDSTGGVSGPALALSEVTIDRVVVTDGSVSLVDIGSGTSALLDKVSFDGEVRAPIGPIRGEGAFVADGQPFRYRLATSRGGGEGTKLRLGIDPSDRPLTIETDGTLTFEGPAPRYEGNIVLARPAGLALSSGKTVASDPWRIDSKLKIDSAVALFEQVDVQYGPDERAIRLAGTAELKFGTHARLNGVLSARQIDLDRALAATESAGRLPIAVLRSWTQSLGDLLRPPVPLSLGIGIDGVTLGGAMLQQLRADLTVERNTLSIGNLEFRAPGFTQVGLSGRLDAASGEFVGPIALDASDPKTLLAWLDGIAFADHPIGAFRMRCDITIGRQRIALDQVKAEYDHRSFEGHLAYRFATATDPARLDVGLAAPEFDLDAASVLARTVLAGAATTGATFEWPGEIALTADLGRVTFAGAEGKAAKANLTFDRSGLRIDALSIADFGGAAINAKGQIDSPLGPPHGAVAISLDAQRIDGLAALAASVSPKAANLLRANASRIIPAKLEAELKVDPSASAPATSLGKLKLEGKIGGVRVGLAAEGLGDATASERADLHIDGRLASDDNRLLAALGLEGLAGDKRGASLVLTANGSASGDFKVDVRLSGDGLDAGAVGTFRLADFDVSGNADVSLLAADVRWLWRDSAFPVTLKSRVAINGSEIAFSGLSGTAGGAAVRGRGSLILGQPLRLNADLAVDQVNLPALIAVAIGMPAQGGGNANLSPLPFRPLPPINGRFALDAEQATLAPTVVAKKVRGTLRMTPQEIAFESITGSVGGGTLAADASFRNGPGGLSARGRVSLANADATAVIRGGVQPPVVGRLSSKIEVEGTGSNPVALIGSLSGSGSMTFEGIQIAGLDPKAIDIAVRAIERGTSMAPARIADLVGRGMDAGSLSMPWASVPLSVAAGRVRLGKLVAPPQSNDLTVSGSFDLVDATLDARFTVFGAGEAGQRPEAAILLKGPIAGPRRSVDVSALISWVTMRSVDREARRLDAAERAASPIDGAVTAPGSGPASNSQGKTQTETNIGASLLAPQPAPALPPPLTIARPPGATSPRPAARVQPAPIPLLTPQ